MKKVKTNNLTISLRIEHLQFPRSLWTLIIITTQLLSMIFLKLAFYEFDKGKTKMFSIRVNNCTSKMGIEQAWKE